MQHSMWLAFSSNICLSLESLSPFQIMKQSRYLFTGGRGMLHMLQPSAIPIISMYSNYTHCNRCSGGELDHTHGENRPGN